VQVDALRPACASWMPSFWFWECRNVEIRLMGAIWESVQRPASSGVIRPLGSTEVASMIVREAPRYANAEL
jgi:hypothetical protein